MKILIGILLIVMATSMRTWGKHNYYRDDSLKPLYQGPLFWLIFSVAGMTAFIAGLILLISGINDVL